eukprot:336756_1
MQCFDVRWSDSAMSGGHIICQECKSKLPKSKPCPQCRKNIGTCRNRALEEMAQKMPMPCKNKQFGCQLIILPSDRHVHAVQCKFVPLQCPYGYFGNTKACLWEGDARHLDEDWEGEHYGNIYECTDSVETSRTITRDVEIFSQNSAGTWGSLAAMGDRRFFLVTHLEADRIYMRVLHLENTETFGHFKTRLVLKNGRITTSFEEIQSVRNVCSLDEWFSVHQSILHSGKDPEDTKYSFTFHVTISL